MKCQKEGAKFFMNSLVNNAYKVDIVLTNSDGEILINNKTCYYKFNASINKMLQYRPNNHLIDFLVRFLSEQEIKILDLGFTGSSNSYSGLREYKKSIGAREYIRYNLHNNSLKNFLDTT